MRKYAAEALYLQLLSDSHALGRTFNDTQADMLARATVMTDTGTNGGSGVGVGVEVGAPSTQLVETEAEKNQEKVTKMQHKAVDLEPLFCAFASTAEELDKISEVIASTPWDGDLARAREGRLCVCTMMGVQMISRPACNSGKPPPLFTYFPLLLPHLFT